MPKSRNSPTVSIIIPTWNRADHIARSIGSVLCQSFSEWEIVVVDDGSSDGTRDIVRQLSSVEIRIRLLEHTAQQGAQAARNTGIRNSRGAWIAFLDSDDCWLPDSLERRLEVARRHKVGVVYSDCLLDLGVNTRLRPMGISLYSGMIYDRLLIEPGPMYQSLLVERRFLEKIGCLDESIVSHQEWDTSIRLARFFRFAFVQTPTFIYECHRNHTISKDRRLTASGFRQVLYKHEHQIYTRLGARTLARQLLRAADLCITAHDKRMALHLIARAIAVWPLASVEAYRRLIRCLSTPISGFHSLQ